MAIQFLPALFSTAKTAAPYAAKYGLSKLFGRRKKAPEIPQYTPPRIPQQEELYFTSPEASKGGFSLRDLAARRIRGEDVGYGPGFVDRSTSPLIQHRESRFREFELPQISSELSKRGVARSAGPGLASDVITRATQEKEREVNDILSNLYYLNELQKKRDVTEGIGLAGDLQNQQAELKLKQSAADAGAGEFDLTAYPERTRQFGAEQEFGLDTLRNSGVGQLLDKIMGRTELVSYRC